MKKDNFIGKILVLGLVLIILLALASSVFAITGAIGNGKMVLRAEVGDKIERYVKVINKNDVDLLIDLSVSGDLEKDLKLKEDNFVLKAGEEKKAYFTIDVKDTGVYETNINVQFGPVDGGNGVGLSASITLIAGDGSEGGGSEEDVITENIEDENLVSVGGNSSLIGGNVIKIKDKNISEKNWIIIASFVFMAGLLVLLSFLMYGLKKYNINENIKKGASKND